MSDARELGTFDATMLVMGGIVGVGIFFTPGTVAGLLPAPGAFLGAWALGGLVALFGALTFAELGANIPAAGGWFVYLVRAFGRLPGFLFAWTILGVVSSGAIAVIASFCATQVASLTAWVGEDGSPSHLVFGVGVIVGLTGIALCGIRLGATVQSAVMVLKLTAILALGVAGLAVGLGASSSPVVSTAAVPDAPPGLLAGLAAAALPVFFSYGGWQNLCYAADRVRDPRRTLPRAILWGVLGSVGVYLAVNGGYLAAFGTAELAQRPDFAAALAERVLGPPGRAALQAAMAVSALGVCAVTILLTPGIYVAMAREGLFFAPYGRLVGARGVPVAALLTQGAVALGYLAWSESDAWLGTSSGEVGGMDFETLTGSVVFAEWIFHAAVAGALLRLRRRDGFEPLRGRLARIAPIGYLLAALGVVAGNLAATSGLQVTVGLTAVGAGVVAFGVWQVLSRGSR
ncbi:MAG: amino acid permease [Planctomycetota bacterium]